MKKRHIIISKLKKVVVSLVGGIKSGMGLPREYARNDKDLRMDSRLRGNDKSVGLPRPLRGLAMTTNVIARKYPDEAISNSKVVGGVRSPRPLRGLAMTTTIGKYLLSFSLMFLLCILWIRTVNKDVFASWSPTHGNWLKRQQLNVVNSSTATIHANTPIAISIDTKTLVSQGRLRPDCADLRILYQPSDTVYTELSRYLVFPTGTTCSTSTSTKVYFNLQADLTTTSSSTLYYLYYNNPQATSPSNSDNAFDMSGADALLVCPFSGSTTCAAGETPSTETGAIRYSQGKSALSFDGVNDGITVADSATLNSSYETVEAWIFPRSIKISDIYSRRDGSNVGGSVLEFPDTSGQFICYFYINGSFRSAQTTQTVTINQWNHIACSYDGTTIRSYVNGQADNTTSYSGTINSPTSPTTYVGRAPGGYFDGLIDEVRVSNTVRYSSNFTPSTTPFVRDEFTKLLLHFDENGDDPRQTGKALDDSGNGNHGTITGAKYVDGVIGIDSGSGAGMTGVGYQQSGAYAGHEGVFIEEGTTNKITNPSFENTTYNTNWTTADGTVNYNSAADTFTAGMSKRNSTGPFAAGVMMQGRITETEASTNDILSYSTGTQLNGDFYSNYDLNQGSAVFWITPEWNGNDGVAHYILTGSPNRRGVWLQKTSTNYLYFAITGTASGTMQTDISSWTAGTTYMVTLRWDLDNTLDGTNHMSLSIADTHTFGQSSAITPYASDTTFYLGESHQGYYPANAIIEGLTIYRRPLFDGTYGINVGNGDEINSIYNSGTGKDPTLVTGSWDVVFALPTNAASGSITTGTGNAWSHPHASNLLYTNTTNTGGFMMNGTYTTDGWADEGTPTSVLALATGEKIFSGGYKYVSDAANEGIKYTVATTAGNDYVVRAVTHSDGTAIPKVLITRADGTTEISSLTGTTASTRTAPDTLIFTFEAPATENMIVKLINTATTGTTYWHQVEVLANSVNNPSMERVTGTPNPWIPDGWTNWGLDSGDSELETTTFHSGLNSIQSNLGWAGGDEAITWSTTATTGKYYSHGGFSYSSGTQASIFRNSDEVKQDTGTAWTMSLTTTSSWSRFNQITKATTAARGSKIMNNGANPNYYDDFYSFELSDVSLTVTPASEANSAETSGVRVDGMDTLTLPNANLTDKSGEIIFEFTPRHDFGIWENFGFSGQKPFIFDTPVAGSNYIRLFKTGTSLLLRAGFNVTGVDATWATPVFNAGTTYIIKITYLQGGFLKLYVDGVEKASTAIGSSSAFSAVPATAYFGSSYAGDYQVDATFDTATVTAPTPSENTTAPYYKFGSKSAKITNTSGDAGNYVTTVDPDSTATHTLSAYVYDGTTGNIGGTVDSKVAALVFEGATKTTTYTDMGGGWWRLTYSGATTDTSNTYGIHVTNGKTIYLDGVQLEAKTYATTYADGSLGTGYAWTGTANASTSTRTAELLSYSKSLTSLQNAGSISFWMKPNWSASTDIYRGLSFTSGGQAQLAIAKTSGGSNNQFWVYANNTSAVVGSASTYFSENNNVLVTFTWTNGGSLLIYLNGTLRATSGTVYSSSGANFGNFWLYPLYSNYINSLVEDIRLYSSVLSSTQIIDLYQSGLMSRQDTGQTVVMDRFDESKGENPLSTYHMDEGYGTTVNDSTTNLNHLTLSGATWIPASAGMTGGGGGMTPGGAYLKFDGTNDSLSRTFDQDFNFGTGVFTLSGMFRHPSTITGTDTILSRQSGSIGYKVYMTSSGYLCFSVNTDSTCTTTSLTDSKWHYFSAVRGATTLTMYIDGKQASQATGLVATTVNGTNTLYIGTDSDGASNYYDGFLDELYIYPSERTSAQALTDYNAHASVLIGSRNNDNLTDGLVGWWKMDESSWNGTAGEVIDNSGNGSNGTSVNGATTTASGKFSYAGSFDGTDDYLTLSSAVSFGANDPFTVSFWANNTGTGSSGSSGVMGSTGGGAYLGYGGSTSTKSFVFSSCNVTLTSTAWDHITMTRLSDLTIKIYKNSSLIKTCGVTSVAFSVNTIGRFWNNNQYVYKGSLDDVRVYNRALSSNEVAHLYEYAPGPVAHWKFDEGTGQSTNDSSGNGNTGTLGASSASATDDPTWVTGKYGKGLSFDGSDDFVGTAEYPLASAYTVDFWAKPLNSNAFQGITGKVSTSYINLESDQFHYSDEGTHHYTAYTQDLAWHHYAITRDSSYNIKVFIDGVQKDSYAGQVGTIFTIDDIGRFWSNNTYSYQGSIDDFRVYNYARTQKQIVQDMLGSGQTVTAGGGSTSKGKPSAPVAYYKFDEGQGITANNAGNGGGALNGTLTNMSSPATATSGWTNSGKFGKGLALDGSNDYVEIADNNALDVTNITISAWVKATVFGGRIVDKITAGGGDGFLIDTYGSKIRLCAAGGPNCVSSTTTLTAGIWQHIVLTYDGTTVKYYLNGVSDGSSTGSITSLPVNAFTLRVGIDHSGGSQFNGVMDEVKVYNYAISADEVKLDYNKSSSMVLGSTSTTSTGVADNSAGGDYCVPGSTDTCTAPVAEWKMDEGTGTTTSDTSGNNNTGTLTNGTTWTTGKYGKGIKFDGADDYVDLGTGSTLYVGGGDHTVSLWAKWTEATGDARTILNIGASANDFAITTGYTSAGQDKISYAYGANWYYNAGSNLNNGKWHFITATKSGSTVTIYIDGVSKSYTSSPGGIVLDNNNRIASGHFGNFSGDIDNVRIYNYARTPAQIAWDYNRGGPIGWWKLDECQGTTAYDASGNSNNGTITIGATIPQSSAGNCSDGLATSAWFNGKTGKVNSSLKFDGVDDYTDLGTSTILEPTTSLSVSAWVYRTGSMGNYSGIFSSRKSVNNEYGYMMVGNSENKIRLYTYINGWVYAETNNILPLNTWTNLTGTWDGSTIKIYVNGVLQTTTGSTPSTIVYPSTPTQNHYIGLYGRIGVSAQYFPGQIDDVRIYNYALTGEQVKTLYGGGAVKFGN